MEQLLSNEFLDDSVDFSARTIYDSLAPELTAKDTLNQSLELDQRELLPNQVLPFVDRLSMAHSVEVRVPYLDHRIIEFANRLPGNLKIREGVFKYIHRKAIAKILPANLVHRQKEGFVQPIYAWMHSALREWISDCLDSLPSDLFNQGYILKLKELFRAGDQKQNAKIWNLACFSIWFERVKAS
jgi:asparagine synthase (glutamine-hydrolysing)